MKFAERADRGGHREPGWARREEDLRRIEKALEAAAETLRHLPAAATPIEHESERKIVTPADRAVNERLQELLPRQDEGWLSEETVDDLARLTKPRVWIVDPLDGTREFVAGIPEWCVSVGLVEEGRAVAGGILNPATGELFVGSLETGVAVNGRTPAMRSSRRLEEMRVLASRSEVKRGDWDRYRGAPFRVEAVGSVAYKLARVAAGLADATWTFTPKHEWDVAAGVALVKAAAGVVWTPDGRDPVFNCQKPFLEGLLAFTGSSAKALLPYLRSPIAAGGFAIG